MNRAAGEQCAQINVTCMQTTLSPQREKGDALSPSWLPRISFPLENKACWVVKEDYVKDELKLPQLRTWFKATGTELVSAKQQQFRPTKLGSFTHFLKANLLVTDTAGTAASLRGPRSVRFSTWSLNTEILHLWELLIKHQAYYSQTCSLFICSHSFRLVLFCYPKPPVRCLLPPLDFFLSCFLQDFMPQHGWL